MEPLSKESDSLLELIDSYSLKANFKGEIGLEKECLRVFSQHISKKNHMRSLGAPLCNSFITTDFAEAQLELITPPFSSNIDLSAFLDNLQHYVAYNIDNEYLWPFSIPARTKNSDEVTIAYYGKSNRAQYKRIYRNGLAERYGKTMQTISGIHFNYSFNREFWNIFNLKDSEDRNNNIRTETYFRALRNIQRNNWLLLYLFGASPIVGKDLINNNYKFIKANDNEYYLPFATSLRMSSMGYQNISQSNLFISLDNINSYTNDLSVATQTPSKIFRKIDTSSKKKFAQLNSNILQNEDEYYAMSRPKSNNKSDQRQISKLNKYGVDYLELRSLDLNPYSRQGIDQEDLLFVELFILFCTLSSSPKISKEEFNEVAENSHIVSIEGRKEGIKLLRNGEEIPLKEWAIEIIHKMLEMSEMLGFQSFNISKYLEQIRFPETTLSGVLLETVIGDKMSFYELGDSIGTSNKSHYKEISKSNNPIWSNLESEAHRSIQEQEYLESKNEIPFKEYLNNFFV